MFNRSIGAAAMLSVRTYRYVPTGAFTEISTRFPIPKVLFQQNNHPRYLNEKFVKLEFKFVNMPFYNHKRIERILCIAQTFLKMIHDYQIMGSLQIA